MKKSILKFALLPLSSLVIIQANAATPVNLMQHPLINRHALATQQSEIDFVEIRRAVDFNHTLHIRMQQTYAGYPVWGADSVVHVPNVGDDKNVVVSNAALHKGMHMNGMYYQDLNTDLANTPKKVFGKNQAKEALQKAIADHMQTIGGKVFELDEQSQLMVYIDKDSKAHWAYKISFRVPSYRQGKLQALPTYIMDALTFHVYQKWNNLQTITHKGGGYGGNQKMGMLTYDGHSLPVLHLTRDPVRRICKLHDKDVVVRNWQNNELMYFDCPHGDMLHYNLYWDGLADQTGGSYSPANDALFGGRMLKNMYKDWYKVEALSYPDAKPMMLKLYVHDLNEGDNAHWDPMANYVVLGDGASLFYSLTSVGVIGHEVSHGFTQQHSNLIADGQSGAMNESFSDMAAQAAEVFAFGSNSWKIGSEIMKRGKSTGALRYMEKPSMDCAAGVIPGTDCSIDSKAEYYEGLNVHYGAGVYNRFFYLLANSAGWDVKSAFGLMVQANGNYWTSSTDFNSGACDVLKAAEGLNMNTAAIKAAFDAVKVDYTNGGKCS